MAGHLERNKVSEAIRTPKHNRIQRMLQTRAYSMAGHGVLCRLSIRYYRGAQEATPRRGDRGYLRGCGVRAVVPPQPRPNPPRHQGR
ncbi:unnamed protein product [Leptidea sinapis]|uniref:Uncharacterized protein n=1 Tax=Leptidea sinapis TaxID=189913 RepID=A0A5E4Q4C5_9NEOP|nr:unnamed protein product [Leptidea sinapis]